MFVSLWKTIHFFVTSYWRYQFLGKGDPGNPHALIFPQSHDNSEVKHIVKCFLLNILCVIKWCQVIITL